MGLYNMLFGVNSQADILLATLNLTRDDVGRFRDAYISDGKIAVYTRNGGGNRACWHEDGEGNPDCQGEAYEVEENEQIRVPESEASNYPKVYNVTYVTGHGLERLVGTGKRIMVAHHTCTAPDSAACTCPGCVIEHRLPLHPDYLYDEDDDFDATYATIYFKFPEAYREILMAMDQGQKIDPDVRWLAMLENIKNQGAA